MTLSRKIDLDTASLLDLHRFLFRPILLHGDLNKIQYRLSNLKSHERDSLNKDDRDFIDSIQKILLKINDERGKRQTKPRKINFFFKSVHSNYTFNMLPIELHHYMASFLSFSEKMKLRTVSKAFKTNLDEMLIYKKFLFPKRFEGVIRLNVDVNGHKHYHTITSLLDMLSQISNQDQTEIAKKSREYAFDKNESYYNGEEKFRYQGQKLNERYIPILMLFCFGIYFISMIASIWPMVNYDYCRQADTKAIKPVCMSPPIIVTMAAISLSLFGLFGSSFYGYCSERNTHGFFKSLNKLKKNSNDEYKDTQPERYNKKNI